MNYVSELNLDIVALTEIWNNERQLAQAAQHMRMDFVHWSRSERGGGVAVLWRTARYNGRDLSSLLPAHDGGAEIAAVELTPRAGGSPLRVASIYIPPLIAKANEKQLTARLEKISNDLRLDVIMGDWNAKHQAWSLDRPLGGLPTSAAAVRGKALNALFDRTGYDVVPPNDDTRKPPHGAPSTLDFAVLSDQLSAQVQSCEVASSCTLSDHDMVHLTIHTEDIPMVPVSKDNSNNHSKIDAVAWHRISDADKARAAAAFLTLVDCPAPKNVDSHATWYLDCLHKCMDHLPRVRNKQQFVVPKSIRDAGDCVKAATAKFTTAAGTSTTAQQSDLEQLQQEVAAQHKKYRVACADFSRKLLIQDASASSYDETMAWRVYKRATTAAARSRTVSHGDESWSTDAEQAAGFHKLFTAKSEAREAAPYHSSCFANAPPGTDGVPSPPPFSLDEVKTAVFSNRVAASSDPWGIHPRLLRFIVLHGVTVGGRELGAQSLADLFTKIVTIGRIPRSWKKSVVTPLPKAGRDPQLAASYRPVANVQLLSRTFERCLLRRMQQRVRLSPQQYGFRPGSSTLEPVLEKVLAIIDSQKFIVKGGGKRLLGLLLSFDFTDAFNRVSADRVVEQYLLLGGERCYASVLYDFVSDRKMRTRVGGTLSDESILDVGVPQGTVLGPYCWSLVCEYIISHTQRAMAAATQSAKDPSQCLLGRGGAAKSNSDLVSTLLTHAYYADDSGEYIAAATREALEIVAQRLAVSFAALAARLGIEVSKKSVMTLFAASPSQRQQQITINLPGWSEPLTSSGDPVRDLGVMLDPDMSFDTHLEKAKKALSMCVNALRRTTHLMSPKTARSIYLNSGVARVLFCSSAYYFSLSSTQQQQLEALHSKAARVITGCCSTSRTRDVLAEARLSSLRHMAYMSGSYEIEKIRGRPDTCPVKQRLLCNTGSLPLSRSEAAHLTAVTTAREACPDPVPGVPRVPLVAHLPQPLFSNADTHAASNVRFFLHHVGMPRKEDIPTPLLRQLNISRLSALPSRHWRMLADGACTPAEGPKPARTGCASMLQLHEDSDYFKTIDTSLSQLVDSTIACSFSCESHAAIDGLHMTMRHLHLCDACGTAVAPLDTDVGGPLPLVVMLDALSVLLKLAKGATAQVDFFGAKLWQLLLQIAKFRPVYCAFFYSHCGFGVQDMIDVAANEAADMHPLAHQLRPLWHQDVARQQVTAIKNLERHALQEAHKTQDSFRALFCDAQNESSLVLRFSEARSIHRMRVGVDPALGAALHTPTMKVEVCPLPLCNCLIDRAGLLRLSPAQQQQQNRQRGAVGRLRAGLDRIIANPIVEHAVAHFFHCPSMAAVHMRRHIFGGDGQIDGSILWSSEDNIAKVLEYRGWFSEARSAMLSGGHLAPDTLTPVTPAAPPHDNNSKKKQQQSNRAASRYPAPRLVDVGTTWRRRTQTLTQNDYSSMYPTPVVTTSSLDSVKMQFGVNDPATARKQQQQKQKMKQQQQVVQRKINENKALPPQLQLSDEEIQLLFTSSNVL